VKLRTHNILAILPIFLGMTCIIGFSRYTAEIHEIRWGLREEIASYAISIAAFLSPRASTQKALLQDDSTPWQHALPVVLARIAATAAQRLRYVILYDATGQKPLVTWGVVPESHENTVPSETLALLRQGHLVRDDMPPVTAAQQLMTAYAPIKALSGSVEPGSAAQGSGQTDLVGILRVAIETRDVQKQAQAIFRQISLHSGILLLLGLGVIVLISAIVSRPINSVTQLVARTGSDVGYEPSGVISIQEFRDLGNTFDTMRDVLEESETRLNRFLIQGTQFRSRIDLAKAYVEDFWPPLHGRFGDVEVAGGLFGERFTGSFFGVLERGDGFYALAGRIQGEGDLDPVVMASGAWSFIKADLLRFDLQEVFERVADIFVFEAFVCVHWAGEESVCQVWMMEPLPPTVQYGTRPFQPPDLMRLVDQYCALGHRQQPFHPDDTIAIHTFAGETAEKIDIYLRRFPQLSPEDLLQELAIFLGPECDGAMVVVKHQGPASNP
jgi:hypothetical protein